MDFLDEAKERFENLKKLSGELRDDVIEKYPELRKDEIKYLTQLLGMELEILFSSKFAADDSRNNIY
ncbi:hypothetical protein BCB68_05250 [Leptotrichia sp. oral taxon 498]|jgi:hypothetical protein|uniref:hypothetical protein n=1 Tax=Leptotrichia sp. oral taxon 498 TaxID=712368 RepID=UPI000B8C99FB|nr:hypothetical protein [Leptotrichia sp. oral taxon 498]ASQ48386.1 hypothetical protein BCB68_05250 [Leptotrichia sp. oral taxon 498]